MTVDNNCTDTGDLTLGLTSMQYVSSKVLEPFHRRSLVCVALGGGTVLKEEVPPTVVECYS